jgi:hypothetical protein
MLVAVSICAVSLYASAVAQAQSYSASGQVGYLQEWELKAKLAKSSSMGKVEYRGPLTLRHTGLCSVNGAEEKSGELRLTVARWTSGVEGTLAMEGDSCKITASSTPAFSGLLSCRNAQGVPINFSIEEETAARDQGRQARGK